jgi:hypothetical protein
MVAGVAPLAAGDSPWVWSVLGLLAGLFALCGLDHLGRGDSPWTPGSSCGSAPVSPA